MGQEHSSPAQEVGAVPVEQEATGAEGGPPPAAQDTVAEGAPPAETIGTAGAAARDVTEPLEDPTGNETVFWMLGVDW